MLMVHIILSHCIKCHWSRPLKCSVPGIAATSAEEPLMLRVTPGLNMAWVKPWLSTGAKMPSILSTRSVNASLIVGMWSLPSNRGIVSVRSPYVNVTLDAIQRPAKALHVLLKAVEATGSSFAARLRRCSNYAFDDLQNCTWMMLWSRDCSARHYAPQATTNWMLIGFLAQLRCL